MDKIEEFNTQIALAASLEEESVPSQMRLGKIEELDMQVALAASLEEKLVKDEYKEAKRTTEQSGSVGARDPKQYETDWPEHFRDDMTAQAASSSGSAKAQPTPPSPVTYMGLAQSSRVRVIPM